MTGNSETNEYRGSETLGSRELSFDSAGVGLSYYLSRGRFIDITYNESTRDSEDKEEFLGVNLVWQFSARTSVTANYGRRFYGKSGNFAFTHNRKRLRTTIGYNESVSSYTRLIAEEQSLGTFVCPSNAVDFSGCFQPDTLDYQLAPGESLRELNALVPEISEEITLRRRLSPHLVTSSED